MNSQTKTENKFYIHTLGCKVNQYESQAMREMLEKGGFKECLSKEIADIYIINSCTVTHHADRETRHLAGLFHRINPKAKIVVAGCYVERNAGEISFLPGVAHIVKNADKARIAEILTDENWQTGKLANWQTELCITGFKGRTKAFVKIQDGCENACSYCKVPLVRGALKSRPLTEITAEAAGLAASGFKELVLTGICLGAWGRDISQPGLINVLKAVERISGDFRIRLSSIEPKYVTDELIEFISGSKRICRHLHIPLQSGDDEILRKMNRPYTSGEYRVLIEKLRGAMEDIAISTDVMVGFPQESDANFRNTMDFLKSIMPARTHIFSYSPRDGTAAHDMPGEVAENALKKRYCTLKATASMSSYLYRERFLGRSLEVLVESKRDKNTDLLTGYSDNYIKTLFEGPDVLMGKVVSVRIEELNMIYTKGIHAGA